MSEDISVKLEALSEEAFAPYGWVLAGGRGTPTFSRPMLDFWKFPFDSDAPARLQIMRYHHEEMVFHRLERHLYVTEARFPASGASGVLIVGGKTATNDPNDVPDPSAIRAFLLDGSCGIMFHKGVWHGLDCFPVKPPFSDFYFLVDEVTEREIETIGGPVSGKRTHVIDYATRDVSFRVTDPDGLAAKIAG